MPLVFQNRAQAGQMLAAKLALFADRNDVIVLALPRGGVPIGYEVAQALHAPLDVFVVRKLGVPGQEELAMGAIASGGAIVVNEDVVRFLQIDQPVIECVAEHEFKELERREREYRGDRPKPDVHNRTVILVDDGLATGSTMRAAVRALRNFEPARIIVATPTASRRTRDELRREVSDCVCVDTPDPFYAVGQYYDDFSQVTDDQVREFLDSSAANTKANERIQELTS